MASLIEDLIHTLDLENSEYEELLKLSKEKTPIIIEGNTEKLSEIVALEQVHTDRLAALEKKRLDVVCDIATVLNKDVDTLTVKHIVNLLKGQEKEQSALAEVHDKLKLTLNDMVVVNEINKQLIEESLELVDFNINYINGLGQMPEVANYTKSAYNSSSGIVNSRFDAKN
ncbi:MAG: flagellar protein FlgN [Lachnospiraceae bacterium]|nr:flagellar protein FlgN [Lachnospiraceae bacterium]